MDRKSQQCMAQIIFEIGQDSLWQWLLQNTLPVPTQSHQASTLQPQGFESTHKSFRGGFLLSSKPANLKKQRILRRKRHCQPVPRTEHQFSALWDGIPGLEKARGELPSFREERGHQPHFVTAPHAAAKWQQGRTKNGSYEA